MIFSWPALLHSLLSYQRKEQQTTITELTRNSAAAHFSSMMARSFSAMISWLVYVVTASFLVLWWRVYGMIWWVYMRDTYLVYMVAICRRLPLVGWTVWISPRSILPSSFHPLDSIWTVMNVWWLGRKIIRTVLCCFVYNSFGQWCVNSS